MEQGLVQSAVSAGILREEWPEYRLVIPAEDPVSRQVSQLRRDWQQVFGGSSSERPPSITIACMHAREEMESILIRWISRICDNQSPFTVTLNNFSAVPPHIVYIRVQDETPFFHMAGQLREMVAFVQTDREGLARVFDKPFIKLGALPEDRTGAEWFHYAHQLFHAAFTARKMVLFRKEKDSWKTVSVFPFKSVIP